MPWPEESTMDLRRQFVQDVQSGIAPMTELCAAYQISRKTGYKWLTRFEAGGLPALADQSRRPQTSPTATAPELVRTLLAARERHPTWGPRKLLHLVRQQRIGIIHGFLNHAFSKAGRFRAHLRYFFLRAVLAGCKVKHLLDFFFALFLYAVKPALALAPRVAFGNQFFQLSYFFF